MSKRNILFILSLTASISVVFAPTVKASTAPTSQYDIIYDEPFYFTPSVAAGSPDTLLFSFGTASGGADFAPAEFTMETENAAYDSGYDVDYQAITATGHYGVNVVTNVEGTSSNPVPVQINLYNNGASTDYDFSTSGEPYDIYNPDNGVKEPNEPSMATMSIPFSSVGSTPVQFFMLYADDPTSTPFTLQEQYTNPSGQLVTNTLMSGNFNSDGTFTPNASSAPEPSQVGMLCLMGLGLGGLLWRAKKRKVASYHPDHTTKSISGGSTSNSISRVVICPRW